MELAFLDLIKLSPRLPSQRAWMCWITYPGISRIGQFHASRRESIGCSQMQLLHEPPWTVAIPIFSVLANPSMKMSETLPMCSTMTTLTIRRIISIVLVVQVVLDRREPQSLSSPLTVCVTSSLKFPLANNISQIKSRLVIS